MAQLLQNAVYGTALILAAAAMRLVLKGRLPPEARLCLWAACLLRLLTPAAPESMLSLWGLFAKPAPAPGPARTPAPYAPAPSPGVPAPQPPQTPQLYIPAAGGEAYVPAPPAGPGAAFPWGAALIGLWLAAGIALAVWYAVSWNRTRRAVTHAAPIGRDNPRYAPLPKCARLREGPMEGAPLTFGVVKPTVVLPPGLEGDALDCVLAHEGVHARRRDNLWHYAMALVLVVHWWNPAVWLMARLLRRDIELSCDRAALKKLGEARRADYARVLVSLSTQGGSSAFSHAFGRKLTEERITAIMKHKKTTALGLALSILLVCGVTVAFATEPQTAPEPAVTETAENVEPALTNDEILRAEEEARREQWRQSLEQSFKKQYEMRLKASGIVVNSALQSICTHSVKIRSGYHYSYYDEEDGQTHQKWTSADVVCKKCGFYCGLEIISIETESHSWTAVYVGSNHLGADPGQHYLIFERKCSLCKHSDGTYTVPAGCRGGNCVDPYSLTPESDVPDPAAP